MIAGACRVWGVMGRDWMTVREVVGRLPADDEGRVRGHLEILVREGYAERRTAGTMVQPRVQYRRRGSEAPSEDVPVRDLVLTAMARGTVHTGSSLSKDCHTSYRTVMRALEDLEEEGRVVQMIHRGQCYWRLRRWTITR